jgi:hypothetical protein
VRRRGPCVDAIDKVFRTLRQSVVHDMPDIIHMNPRAATVGATSTR